MSRKVIRDQIVALKQAGLSDKEVMKQLDVSRKTVFNAMKYFCGNGQYIQLADSWPEVVCSDREVCENREEETPEKSTQECAENGKGAEDVGKISEKDCQRGVRLKSIQIQRRHLISDASKKKRLDRAKTMFAEIERASRKNIIWSDEKKSLCKLSTMYTSKLLGDERGGANRCA